MAHSDHKGDQPPEFGEAVRLGHEPLTVSVAALVVGTALILVVLAASMLLMYWLVIGTVEPQTVGELRTEVARQRTQEDRPPDPQVEPNQALELQQFTRSNRELLESYGWIDERRGIARIPVERAIELLAEHGDPGLRVGEHPRTGGSAAADTGAAETNGR